MMKEEPNSEPFKTICQGVIGRAEETDPVRKVFQHVLMKSVGEHDLSKQECHHILNMLDFVEMSRDIVTVNVNGTKKIRVLDGNEHDTAQVLQDNLASIC